MNTVGVIGGSGLYEIEGLSDIESISVETPWGSPSDELVVGMLGDVKMVFLPRHGRGHVIMPSEINFRANIYAMKKLGVEWIIAVSAIGSMKEEYAPGHVVVPSQYFDHTKGRKSTFFGEGIAAHVSLADPVCPVLSGVIAQAARSAGATVHEGGLYICMEGPQFSTRGESEIYRSWGVDVIGMTNMPEAKLAREAEICYASLSLVTDYDCWHDGHDDVTVEDLIATLTQNVALSKNVLEIAAPEISAERDCVCESALKNAIITSPGSITQQVKDRLGIIIERYVK